MRRVEQITQTRTCVEWFSESTTAYGAGQETARPDKPLVYMYRERLFPDDPWEKVTLHVQRDYIKARRNFSEEGAIFAELCAALREVEGVQMGWQMCLAYWEGPSFPYTRLRDSATLEPGDLIHYSTSNKGRHIIDRVTAQYAFSGQTKFRRNLDGAQARPTGEKKDAWSRESILAYRPRNP